MNNYLACNYVVLVSKNSKNYTQKLKHLKMSAKMLEFKNVDFTFSTLSQTFFAIKIKLHSTFLELSIDSVETIVDRAYEKLSQHFQWNSVEITPLIITFIVFEIGICFSIKKLF